MDFSYVILLDNTPHDLKLSLFLSKLKIYILFNYLVMTQNSWATTNL